MKKSLKRTMLLTLASLASLSLLPGCVVIAAAGAGAGAYAYIKGSLDSHLEASIEPCIVAVQDAMDDLGYVKTKTVTGSYQAKLIYRDSLDNKIIITLQQKKFDLTSINIRVGHIGDESQSIDILRNIQAQL